MKWSQQVVARQAWEEVSLMIVWSDCRNLDCNFMNHKNRASGVLTALNYPSVTLTRYIYIYIS